MARADIGKNPVPGDSPAGIDISFEPEFEALEAELQKLSSPTATGAADWGKIAKLAEGIIEEKSKNLLVAGYLNLAMVKNEGFPGLVEGVHILRDMLETYWETMFPPKKRMRGRANAIIWWMERIDTAVDGMANTSMPRDEYDRFTGDLDFIDSFLSENMEGAPILRPLTEKVTGLVDVVEPPPPPPEHVESSPEAGQPESVTPSEGAEAIPKPIAAPRPAPASPSVSASPAVDLTGADAGRILAYGLEVIGQAASAAMAENRYNPLPYRLTRLAAWFEVNDTPPATGGRTMVPPPEDYVTTIFSGLRSAANWSDLLDAAESRVGQFLFWLDLSRYSAESLERLGHPECAEVIAAETASYAKRLPGIENLSFSNGLAFADPTTKEWLAAAMAKLGGGEVTLASGVEVAVAEALVESQKLLGENKMDLALDGFRSKLSGASSAREKFLWTAGFCRLLLDMGKAKLMTPYIREMIGMLDTYGVERWEPELAADGLMLAARGIRLRDGGESLELDAVVNRLVAVSPARALEFLE